MKNFFGHLFTVIKHKFAVFLHSTKLGMPFQGFMHDMSKFSICEFSKGIKYYTNGTKSPNEGERADKGYSKAWMHHKGRNKHHFEYWTDYSHIERKIVPVKMEYKYLLEMFCDRVAASKIYQGKNYTDSHPYEYFLKGKVNRFIHPKTSLELENMLSMLSEKGEKYTFDYIRKNKKHLEAEYNKSERNT